MPRPWPPSLDGKSRAQVARGGSGRTTLARSVRKRGLGVDGVRDPVGGPAVKVLGQSHCEEPVDRVELELEKE